jgi:hypothetical protein
MSEVDPQRQRKELASQRKEVRTNDFEADEAPSESEESEDDDEGDIFA